MNYEHAIKVIMEPHKHGNPAKPYFWCILRFDKVWQNICFGWSVTPEQAFKDARGAYNKIE